MARIGSIGKGFPSELRRWSGLLSLACLLLLGACAYRGGGLEAPFSQKLTWFSLINGDDIRAACHEGSPERLRLVYNGRYHEQLRIYDLVASDPAGANAGGAEVTARVQDSASYNRLGSLDLRNPLSAWQWRTASASLGREDYGRLQRALEQAGLGDPPPIGTELRSTRFYWIAVACVGGRIWFQAWQDPESDVSRLPFVALLLAADDTGVPFNAPRSLSAAEAALEEPGPEREQESFGFSMRVAENGLAGLL